MVSTFGQAFDLATERAQWLAVAALGRACAEHRPHRTLLAAAEAAFSRATGQPVDLASTWFAAFGCSVSEAPEAMDDMLDAALRFMSADQAQAVIDAAVQAELN